MQQWVLGLGSVFLLLSGVGYMIEMASAWGWGWSGLATGVFVAAVVLALLWQGANKIGDEDQFKG